MKKMKLIIISLFVFTGCKAQQIIDLYGSEDYGLVNGAYYKDLTDFQNQYVGTWLYTNGNTSLKLVFKKKNHLTKNSIRTFYEDMLVGEYQYIENGIEKVNTLANINIDYGNNSKNMEKHNLISLYRTRSIKRYNCPECSPNEWRIVMSLSEPNYDGVTNEFVMRRFIDNGVEKLKIWFKITSQIVSTNPDGTFKTPAPYKLPVGEYVLVKQ